MLIQKLPMELFEIAASFKDTAFKVEALSIIDTLEFQLTIMPNTNNDVAIYVKFSPQSAPTACFGETYSGSASGTFEWTNAQHIINEFDKWHLELFGNEESFGIFSLTYEEIISV